MNSNDNISVHMNIQRNNKKDANEIKENMINSFFKNIKMNICDIPL